MLLTSILFLAVAAALAAGVPQENGIRRRTDDDGKDRNPSAATVYPSLGQLLSSEDGISFEKDRSVTVPTATKDLATSIEDKDKVLTSSLTIGDKSASLPLKDQSLTTPSATKDGLATLISKKEHSSTSFVTEGEKLTPLPDKDKTSTLLVTRDDKLTSVVQKDKAPISPPSQNDKSTPTFLVTKDDKSTSLPVKDKITGPPVIVYSVTIPATLTLGPKSNSTPVIAISPSNIIGSPSEFSGYEVVPSPIKRPLGKIQSYTTTSVIPVYTPALLGNAYGGGLIVTPSVYVTKRPFPYGPSEGVPPGYGSYSKTEIVRSFTPLPSGNADKNKTSLLSVSSTVKPAKDVSSKVESSVLSGSLPSNTTTELGKPEATLTIVSASSFGPLPFKTGINGNTVIGIDHKKSAEAKGVPFPKNETLSYVQYLTETILTTTTYCPVTVLSGKTSTLSSTTLTETLVTLRVVPVAEKTPAVAGPGYVVSATAPSGKVFGLNESLTAIERVASSTIATSKVTSLGLGELTQAPSREFGVSGGLSTELRSDVVSVTYQSIASHETRVKIESGNVVTVSGTNFTALTPVAASKVSSKASSQAELEYATTESSPPNPTEGLSGAPVKSNGKSGLHILSNSATTSRAAAAAQSAAVSSSGGASISTVSAIPVSLVTGLSSLLKSINASTLTASAIPASLISELSSLQGSLGGSIHTNTAAQVSPISTSPHSSGSPVFNLPTRPVIPAPLISELSSLLGSSGVNKSTGSAVPASLVSGLSSLLVGFGALAVANTSTFLALKSATSTVGSVSDLIGITIASGETITGPSVNGGNAVSSSFLGLGTSAGGGTSASILPVSLSSGSNTLGNVLLAGVSTSLTSGKSFVPSFIPGARVTTPAEGSEAFLSGPPHGFTAPSVQTSASSPTSLNSYSAESGTSSTLSGPISVVVNEALRSTEATPSRIAVLGQGPTVYPNGVIESTSETNPVAGISDKVAATRPQGASGTAGGANSIVGASGNLQLVSSPAAEFSGGSESVAGASKNAQAATLSGLAVSIEAPKSNVATSPSVQTIIPIYVAATSESSFSFGPEITAGASASQPGAPSAPTPSVSLTVSEGANFSSLSAGTSSSLTPGELPETSTAAGISYLPLDSSLSAAPESSATALMTANTSTSTAASTISIAQGAAPESPVLSTYTSASLSGGITTSRGGNDSVSVLLSPTAVSPFQGAGMKMTAPFCLGLSVLLGLIFV